MASSTLHPIRFLQLRKDPLWFEAVEELSARCREDDVYKLMSVSEFVWKQHKQSDLLKAHERRRYTNERLERAIDDDCPAHGLESAFRSWRTQGEQIFDLSPIAPWLKETDCTDVPIDVLKFPYDVFYLHWGKAIALSSPVDGRVIEGCYLRRNEWDTYIDLVFVSSLPDSHDINNSSLVANLCVDGEGVFDAMLNLDEGKTFGSVLEDLDADNVYTEYHGQLWRPFLREALSIAANGLCYLTSEDKDVETTYPVSAPQRLVNQTRSTRPTERNRATSKLNSLGFHLIHLCGQRLRDSLAHHPVGGSTVAPHWRRGHWRHQRYGAGRAAVKLLWIKPLMVNADEGVTGVGHIYVP